MKKEDTNSTILDADKFLNPVVMRINLLLVSLYLSAYEILKATIIEGVKNLIVYLPQPDEKAILDMKNELSANEFQSVYDANILSYKKLIEDYEREVGVKFKQRDHFGLIPSCKWLAKEGVLLNHDIENVKKVKNHRNRTHST